MYHPNDAIRESNVDRLNDIPIQSGQSHLVAHPTPSFKENGLWLLPVLLLASALPSTLAAQEIPHGFNLPPGPRPVIVQAHFFLADINSIDDSNETFAIKGNLTLEWHDERYAFDPDTEGILEKRFQGPFQFLEMYNGWWPQVVLHNGLGSTPPERVSLRISPDGTLLFVKQISTLLKSPMNLRRFPFDQQKLKAIFEPLAFDATQVKFGSKPIMTDLPDRPLRVAGWDLIDLSAQTQEEHDKQTGAEYSSFVVTLDMARNPAMTIWPVMMPLSLIVLLCTAIFWMGGESHGNRLDASFIGLLTVVAYHALVVGGLPKISYFILIDGFIYVSYGTMAASIVANIVGHQLIRRGARAASERLDQIARWVLPAGFIVFNLFSGLYFYYL